MAYHLGRGSNQLGQFTEEEIRAGLDSGHFFSSDLAWQEGMADWKPLSEVLALPVAEPGGPVTEPAVEAASMVEAENPAPASDGQVFPAPAAQAPVAVPAPSTVPPPVFVNSGAVPMYGGSTAGGTGIGVMPTPGTAIASLVLGIVSLVTCYFGLLFAIPGIICGHMALGKIKQSGGRYEGRGLAMAGLVMSYIWLGFALLAFLVMIVVGIIGTLAEQAS